MADQARDVRPRPAVARMQLQIAQGAAQQNPSVAGPLAVEAWHKMTPAHLENLYAKAVTTPGNINEHLPTLRRLASQCDSVTEFGVEHGISTVALLAAQPARLTSYDVREATTPDLLKYVAGRTDFRYIVGDSLAVDIDETDLLFIDSLHTEAQLSGELSRHAAKVRRWIVLHDTVTFGEAGENGQPGLLPAVRAFMAASSEWVIVEIYGNNNGLLVMGRRGR